MRPTTEQATCGRLEVVGVSKSFSGSGRGRGPRNLALRDVSVSIAPSEFVSIVGPSGCGKTTLLRIMAGLLTADNGSVLIDGEPVSGPTIGRSVVFQRPALLPWASTIDNVAIGLRFRGVKRQERLRRAQKWLDTVGLLEYASHLPSQLSGGMQQRAALARALVLDAPILLMDEPFASLDAITRRLLHEELLNIWRDESATRSAVFITHNVDEAVLLGDRVIIMSPSPGEISEIVDVAISRPRTVAHSDSLEFIEARNHIWNRIQEWAH